VPASLRVSAELAVLGAVAAAAAGSAAYILSHSRRDPKEAERRRLAKINRSGRMGDGWVVDISEQALYYTYSVGGVEYTASQDITELRDLLPENLESLIGPVTLKFLPANPGNSIVVSEKWFGIRARQKRLLKKGA
jgi:hypothetical protein